uniref:Uncharacterized protein n=1 Tax=Anguilla anguilla TaxID=7936 RepID=A0A0E9PRF3_ANGAN
MIFVKTIESCSSAYAFHCTGSFLSRKIEACVNWTTQDELGERIK